MTLEEWKIFVKNQRIGPGIAEMILEDWEKERNQLQRIIDDNQDAAVLDFQKDNESKGAIAGIARFRGDKGYGQHHE